MAQEYTIPSQAEINRDYASTDIYKYPSKVPIAAVFEGVLTERFCSALVSELQKEEPYSFGGCGALTREAKRPLSYILRPLVDHSILVNEKYFGFNLDESSATAWLQTYTQGGDYHIHTDAAPGQSRKLTTVAFLTDEGEYEGGELQLINHEFHSIPKTIGTLVTYPSWMVHRVTEVTKGRRQTINLGFWGLPFK